MIDQTQGGASYAITTRLDDWSADASIGGLPVCPFCGQPNAMWDDYSRRAGYRYITGDEKQYHCRQALGRTE